MSNGSKAMKCCFNGKNILSFSKKKKKEKEILLYNCIQTLLSDPIVVLYANDNYICTGSLTGKVCLYNITKKEDKEVNTDISLIDNKDVEPEEKEINGLNDVSQEINNYNNSGNNNDNNGDNNNNNNNNNNINNDAIVGRYRIICMFRDNSIKSLYIDKSYLYVYYGNFIEVLSIKTFEFIKKIALENYNEKQVIYCENLILFNNSKNLFIYDVKNKFMSYFHKKLLKHIIFDFNVNYLLCYKKIFGKCHIKVLQISVNLQKCEHELIFCVDFSSSKFISHGKFLDDEKIVIAKNGNRLIIFDFKRGLDLYRIKKLKKRVLDIYKSAENMLFILVEDKIIILNLFTYIFFKHVQLPVGLFYFKWSYFITYKANKIIFSCDKGIYLIDNYFNQII